MTTASALSWARQSCALAGDTARTSSVMHGNALVICASFSWGAPCHRGAVFDSEAGTGCRPSHRSALGRSAERHRTDSARSGLWPMHSRAADPALLDYLRVWAATRLCV